MISSSQYVVSSDVEFLLVRSAPGLYIYYICMMSRYIYTVVIHAIHRAGMTIFQIPDSVSESVDTPRSPRGQSSRRICGEA